MSREMCYVFVLYSFIREILYCHLWASSECMMQFLDTHKSDRDAPLKCLRMRHTYVSDMQTNIYNAFCMLSIAWRCNDALMTVFRLGNADADSTCGCIFF